MIAFLMDMMVLFVIARFMGRPDAFFWIAWLYYALMESSGLQATLGKHFMGLKVEDKNGNPLTFGRGIRQILRQNAVVHVYGLWLDSAIFYHAQASPSRPCKRQRCGGGRRYAV